MCGSLLQSLREGRGCGYGSEWKNKKMSSYSDAVDSHCELVKAHLHGAIASPDRSAHASHMHSHVYDWSRDLFSSALFVPLYATGWTNRKSRDDRLNVRSNADRATKYQALTGDLQCIARCVGRSNCPVYTVRSARFRSIGRSIARSIAPCKWALSVWATSLGKLNLKKGFLQTRKEWKHEDVAPVAYTHSPDEVLKYGHFWDWRADGVEFWRKVTKSHLG